MAGRFALPEGYQSLQLPISCHNRDEKSYKMFVNMGRIFPNRRLKWTQPLVAGGFACNNGWNVVSFSVENGGNDMEKITSFTIDHIKLQPGLYVSRKDKVGAETVTTFDLRLTKPNDEPVMNTAEVHTIEHLAATYLRNEPTWKDKVLLLRPHGLPDGFLPPADRGLHVQRRCSAGAGLLPLHPGLPGRGCRGQVQKTAATTWT